MLEKVIKEKLVILRKAAHMTQRELAILLGVHRATIMRIESETHCIEKTAALAIYTVLNEKSKDNEHLAGLMKAYKLHDYVRECINIKIKGIKRGA